MFNVKVPIKDGFRPRVSNPSSRGDGKLSGCGIICICYETIKGRVDGEKGNYLSLNVVSL